MDIHITLRPVLALVAGVLVLVAPRLERFAVAGYLIAIGILGIIGK